MCLYESLCSRVFVYMHSIPYLCQLWHEHVCTWDFLVLFCPISEEIKFIYHNCIFVFFLAIDPHTNPLFPVKLTLTGFAFDVLTEDIL